MTAELPLPSALPPVTFVGAGKLGTAVAEAWDCLLYTSDAADEE